MELLGKKIGMTQVFDAKGNFIGVTVVEAGPCTVLQKKSTDTDGYHALQLGFGERKLALDLLVCASERGLETVDTGNIVRDAVAKSSLTDIYINAHMTSRGNKLTADFIADYLKRRPN